ncbi:MAG: hypothetical protein U0793_25410 [Gemmataceae bacterium]
MTGHNEAYYSDYRGQPQEFISAAKWGFLYQGKRYSWQKDARRGQAALDLEPPNFVTFLENHDQVANSGRGERMRLRTSPGRYRRAHRVCSSTGDADALPGQEFRRPARFSILPITTSSWPGWPRGSLSSFVVSLQAWPNLTDWGVPDPHAPDTFTRCKARGEERARIRKPSRSTVISCACAARIRPFALRSAA